MTALLERNEAISEHLQQDGILMLQKSAREAKAWIASKGAYNPADGFQQIGIEELLDVGLRLLDYRNIVQAYNLLAQKARSGKTFYDLIIRPQHFRAFEVLTQTLPQLESKTVEKGLDVATGTGESAIILAQKCDHVTGVDLNQAMLDVANEKLTSLKRKRRIRDFSLVKTDALKMEFPPDTFDIVLDNGLFAYLTFEEMDRYFEKVRTFLRPGGRYYQFQAFTSLRHVVYSTTPRAKLAGDVSTCLNFHNFAFSRLNKPEESQNRKKPDGFGGGIYNVNGGPGNEYLVRFIKQ